MESFDLEGARRAASSGSLSDWLIALLKREPGANRSLAAMICGQRPLLEAPIEIPLDSLERIAGPGPDYKYPKDPLQWEREIAPLLDLPREALPPLLIRETGGRRHLSDGSHRVDAWRRQGETHGWAIVWRDRDRAFDSWWGPFLPAETPQIQVVKNAGNFLPSVEGEGMILAALVGEEIVGAVRLVPEFGALTLRTMKVAPEYRGHRLGARILHHLRPYMDGNLVHCLAFPWLARFYGEFGFLPVEPEELPSGLRDRYDSYQDEKGCLALRRGPCG